MAKPFESLHIAAEVDVDNELWAGIADYQGAPHLLVNELLSVDQPRARRRLGQTFLLIAIPRREFREMLRLWKATQPSVDGDPRWEEKLARWEAAWKPFKSGAIRKAASAWRVRGSFREGERGSKLTNTVRWTLLRKSPVAGDVVRARMERIADLSHVAANPTDTTTDSDLPF